MSSDISERRYLSPAEAAQVLGVKAQTIRERCRDGFLPAIKVGRVWRVDMHNLPNNNDRRGPVKGDAN